MNTRGLAQLAYEKGMHIMTASQNVEEAFVSEKLKHSYLTYALAPLPRCHRQPLKHHL